MESINVITEKLINEAIQKESCHKDQLNIDLNNDQDITELTLDYLNIMKIENLCCYTNLRKLQLNNNIIENIEGLNKLSNLCILDLSFNRIKKIQGLEFLSNLQELSLFCNEIKKLENLENLLNLEFLSVGNNFIISLNEISVLRPLQKLKSLNLAGNPICEFNEYRKIVIANLNELKFLDYSMKDVTPNSLNIENDKDINSFKDGKHVSTLKNETIEINEDTILNNMDGLLILKMIDAEDETGYLLRQLSCVSSHHNEFKNNVVKIFHEIQKQSLEKYAERDTEINLFKDCLEEIKEKNLQSVIEEIDDFTAFKTKTWKEMKSVSDKTSTETIMTLYYDRIVELWERLMYLEVQLVDQLEELIKLFEQNMKDLLNGWMDKIRMQLNDCRKIIRNYNLIMSKEVIIFCDNLMTSQWQEEVLLNDKFREILLKKESVHEVLKNSLEAHLQIIDNFEDDTNKKMKEYLEKYITDLHQKEEVERNRQRVIEINHFVDFLRDEMDNNDPNV